MKETQKDPLGPFVIRWIAGAHLSFPIVTKTNIVELRFKGGNVLLGGNGRMLACIEGILLGGQAKAIKAHWVKYVKSL